MQIATLKRRIVRSAATFLTALLVGTGLTLGLGAAPSIAAAPGSISANHIMTTAPTSIATTAAKSSINPYGCGALVTLGYKQMYVAAFALGYCPSVFVLQGTSWGRAFISWIDDGLCRVPWIVWLATGGRYTSCY
jgi:hypothetical protein